MQETLIAIHQRRGSYNPSLPFTAWLYAIARYKLVDHYRRRGVRKHVPLDEAEEQPGHDRLTGHLAGMDVERLLNELPEKQRAAIQLTRLEGYSIAEAALMSGQSPSGIKIGVHRGMKRLMALVKGKNGLD